MSNSGREVREMNEMVVVLYCSLSESGLSTHSKILALWADVTVSYVALDSVQQHSMELVMEAAVMPLSLVQDMFMEPLMAFCRRFWQGFLQAMYPR
jgi:hypothetical protein